MRRTRKRFRGNAFQVPGTAGYFDSIGPPSFIAYVVFAMEAIGGGWEYPLYLIVLSGAQVLLGEGALSVSAHDFQRPKE